MFYIFLLMRYIKATPVRDVQGRITGRRQAVTRAALRRKNEHALHLQSHRVKHTAPLHESES